MSNTEDEHCVSLYASLGGFVVAIIVLIVMNFYILRLKYKYKEMHKQALLDHQKAMDDITRAEDSKIYLGPSSLPPSYCHAVIRVLVLPVIVGASLVQKRLGWE